MEKKENKPHYDSKSFFLLAIFMFFLVYTEGRISGNSVILTILAFISCIIGLFKIEKFRKWLLRRAGIVEVDLEKDNKHK